MIFTYRERLLNENATGAYLGTNNGNEPTCYSYAKNTTYTFRGGSLSPCIKSDVVGFLYA